MIFKGFKFGLMLQFAVGPMCLLVFNTSSQQGFAKAMVLVLAITLVDACFILLSGFGVARFLQNEAVQRWVKIFGCVILVLFGLDLIGSAFQTQLLPSIRLFSAGSQQSLFLQGILLTASNPLTILFWAGVFSTQIIEHALTRRHLAQFGLGCVLSTVSFLSLVALVGTTAQRFLPDAAIRVLNGLVGILLIYFGIRLVVRGKRAA